MFAHLHWQGGVCIMDPTPSILKFLKILESFVVDQDFLTLIKDISQGKYFYRGKFPLIDTSCPEETSWAITNEVPASIKYSFWNNKDQVLEFQHIFVCSREPREYVFRLDSRHGLNQLLQKNFPEMIHFSLNCVYGVDTKVNYIFYIIPSKEILSKLFDLFYNWLDSVTDNIDD